MIQIKKQLLGGVEYSTPSVSVLHVETEGLLCASTSNATIESAVEENWGEL